MAKTRDLLENLEWELEEDMNLSEEAGPEDYIFVVKPDGRVKAIMLPEETEKEMSPGIKDLMAYFEEQYSNNSSAGQTLH